MDRLSRSRITLHAVVVLAVLAGCSDPRTVAGECKPVFGGDVCTWATVAGDKVTEFGITVPMATVTNAPLDAEMVFPPVPNANIALPAEVVTATGFNYLGLFWEAHGHPPAPFLTPHFDFHLFTVAPDRVAAIDCADLGKPAQLPSEYVLPDIDIPGMGKFVGLCVPGMGMHGLANSELEATSPFGASMVLGYYQKELVFLEPMISQAKLAEAKSFSLSVPRLPGVDAARTWPGGFEATYDAQAKSYRFTFSGLPAS